MLLVITHHYPYVAFLEKVGWAGVDLFFVLSGFLISGLLFAELKSRGTIRIGRFYVRRGFKIYPAFYALLLLTTLAFANYRNRYDFLREALFLQSYWHVEWPHAWPHTWSLAVEEHFYIFLPLLLLALARFKKLRWIPAISVALLVICLSLRMFAVGRNPRLEEILCPTHLRADALFLGVLLSYLLNFDRPFFTRLSRWWLLPVGTLLLIPLGIYGRSLQQLPWVLSLNAAGFALILCWTFPRQFARCWPIERIGVYSYSI